VVEMFASSQSETRWRIRPEDPRQQQPGLRAAEAAVL